jgi:hypothetical protein
VQSSYKQELGDMAPGEDFYLPEKKTDKSYEEDAESAEVVSAEETAVLSQLVPNESPEILSRKELESNIKSDGTKSADEEAVTLKETYGTNSDFSFTIYDNLDEKFDQLEKSFKYKSDSIVESVDESEALDNELPLGKSTQNTYETESPAIVKEEETEPKETGEGEDNITVVKFSAKNETENTKEEESLSVLLFWLLLLIFTVFCNLYIVKYLLLELN